MPMGPMPKEEPQIVHVPTSNNTVIGSIVSDRRGKVQIEEIVRGPLAYGSEIYVLARGFRVPPPTADAYYVPEIANVYVPFRQLTESDRWALAQRLHDKVQRQLREIDNDLRIAGAVVMDDIEMLRARWLPRVNWDD